MRIRYMGLDKRTRVAECNRVKFLADGFQSTDNMVERYDRLSGPVLVAHVYRSKGGKRVIMEPPPRFDMEAAQLQLLEKGFLDLVDCEVKAENLY